MSFVAAHRDRFAVEPILRVLEIPVSTFYGWLAQQRDPCQRRCRDAWLAGVFEACSRDAFKLPERETACSLVRWR